MTLVDAATGEVVEPLDEAAARDITAAIKGNLIATWDLISEAYRRRAWDALGYSSWDDYCRTEFGASRIKLPSEERREVVSSLRDAGLSIRAISAATGAAPNTVQRDLRQVSQSDTPDRPLARTEVEPNFGTKVKGTDGKTYSSTTRTTTTKTSEVGAAPVGEGAATPATPVPASEADAINRAFHNAVDPDLTYRVNVGKAMSKARDLADFDPERAAECAGDSANGHRLLVQSIHRWCDLYLKAAGRPDHLRSVQ